MDILLFSEFSSFLIFFLGVFVGLIISFFIFFFLVRKEDFDVLSALQLRKQIQAGSPSRTMSKVRLAMEEVRVAQEPKKVRTAMVCNVVLCCDLYEYSSADG